MIVLGRYKVDATDEQSELFHHDKDKLLESNFVVATPSSITSPDILLLLTLVGQ